MDWTGLKKHQAATEARPARPAKRTILRRLLSHHELATLLLLLHAPINASAKPEITTLREAGLVEQVPGDTAAGDALIRLTPEGNAVLEGLGIAR
ncbi:MarR family transcriptional regulator [Paraburkholderia sacchari]